MYPKGQPGIPIHSKIEQEFGIENANDGCLCMFEKEKGERTNEEISGQVLAHRGCEYRERFGQGEARIIHALGRSSAAARCQPPAAASRLARPAMAAVKRLADGAAVKSRAVPLTRWHRRIRHEERAGGSPPAPAAAQPRHFLGKGSGSTVKSLEAEREKASLCPCPPCPVTPVRAHRMTVPTSPQSTQMPRLSKESSYVNPPSPASNPFLADCACNRTCVCVRHNWTAEFRRISCARLCVRAGHPLCECVAGVSVEAGVSRGRGRQPAARRDGSSRPRRGCASAWHG
jgi:hypothetical protein